MELLILAKDASSEVKEVLTGLAQEKGICIISWPDKIDLGLIVGKSQRGSLAVTDRGFAEAIKKIREF